LTSISVDERIALLSSVEKRPYRKADFAGSKHDHFRIARDLGAIRQALMIRAGFASEWRVCGIDSQSQQSSRG
jgi:hypothetical protein